ncbi:hypothetical protein SFC66_12465 [Terribacillus saccharophilus]|uniref:hypothetical protein n=1 Tax=Terribacillus saccharophilus TaxID=361277 RepID=UPI003982832E
MSGVPFVSGSSKSAVKEVEKQVTYWLEDEYGKEYVKSISFKDVKAEETEYGENYYHVTGDVKYESTWANLILMKRAGTFHITFSTVMGNGQYKIRGEIMHLECILITKF